LLIFRLEKATVTFSTPVVKYTGSSDLVEVKVLAKKILDILSDEEKRRGQLSVPISSLYRTFEKDASYDSVQQAVKFLVDRDLIAPFAYSLTAKGRRERELKSVP
jgi:hypothetical protein